MSRLGLARRLRWLGVRLEERWRDRALGIETLGDRDFAEALPDAACAPYEPLPYGLLERCLNALPSPEGRVLLDYGSGKGRVLVTAALRPYSRVLGVEVVPELAAAAEANVRRASRHLRCPVAVTRGDARAFEVPHEVTDVVLFNPFAAEVRATVAARLDATLAARPRDLWILDVRRRDQRDVFGVVSWLVRTAEISPEPLHWMRVDLFRSVVRR